jgi:hypothetical protein
LFGLDQNLLLRAERIHFHVSGIPETWKFGLIGSETVTLFRFRPPGQIRNRQASPNERSACSARALSECLRAGEFLGVKTIWNYWNSWNHWNSLLLGVFKAMAGLDPQVNPR